MRLAFEALDEFDPNNETSDSDDDQLAIADSDGTDEDYSLSAADSFEIPSIIHDRHSKITNKNLRIKLAAGRL